MTGTEGSPGDGCAVKAVLVPPAELYGPVRARKGKPLRVSQAASERTVAQEGGGGRHQWVARESKGRRAIVRTSGSIGKPTAFGARARGSQKEPR